MHPQKAFRLALLLVSATFTSLAAKIAYQLEGQGRDGAIKLFEKPWAMTTVMFLSMALCLPLASVIERLQQRAEAKAKAAESETDGAAEPLLNGAAHGGPLPPDGTLKRLRKAAVLCIPTGFDLVATALMNVGLLHLNASIYQMLRGASELLFARIFAAIILKRRPSALHLVGTACSVVGMALVALASILAAGAHSQAHKLLGMGLVVLSQGVQAAQIRYEDFYMDNLNLPPLRIVGYEGLFGSVGMLGVALPVLQYLPGREGHGMHEDSLDTLHMLAASPAILGLLLADMAALLVYNVAGMSVMGRLGAVFRTVLETARTVLVWVGALLLFYLGSGRLGEPWTLYSWLQGAGFLVLVGGTLLYSKGDEKRVQEHLEEEKEFYSEIAGGSEEAAAEGGEANGGEGAAAAGEGDDGLPEVQGLRREDSVQLPATVPISVAAASLKSSMNLSAFNLPRPISRRVADADEGELSTTPRPTWAMIRANPRRGRGRGRGRGGSRGPVFAHAPAHYA